MYYLDKDLQLCIEYTVRKSHKKIINNDCKCRYYFSISLQMEEFLSFSMYH